jgi:hypothetical protein
MAEDIKLLDAENITLDIIVRRLDLIEQTLGDILARTAPRDFSPVPREEMLTRARCQAVAKLLWAENPNMTIAEVARHPKVFNTEITGGKRYVMRTVQDWVAAVFPENQKKQVGRPRKKAG